MLGSRLLGVSLIVGMVSAASAAEVDLPDQLTWTAYDTGSAGYNQAVAIGSALKNVLEVDLRVLPGKNDVSRTELLRRGRVAFSATGSGALMAQEGVFNFANANWGPQPLRMLLANSDAEVNNALGVAADIGVEDYLDLRGKRVAWIRGAPSLNISTEAYLAYAGLTWDDVEKVEFGGFADSWRGMINDQVDAVFASTNSGRAFEAAASPRGLIWPPIDSADTKGIERMQAVQPMFEINSATIGANISAESPSPGARYAYPVLTTLADQDEDLVYNMTKAMIELYPIYEDSAPGIDGWALDRQNFESLIPYHKGAIRYFKERGVWNDHLQEHNDRLEQRQVTLESAWNIFKDKGTAEEDWDASWDTRRQQALEQGGFRLFYEIPN